MITSVLFDLDGTLTDPGEGITHSIAYALAKFGISVADRRELYSFIGPPLVDAFCEKYGFSRAHRSLPRGGSTGSGGDECRRRRRRNDAGDDAGRFLEKAPRTPQKLLGQ